MLIADQGNCHQAVESLEDQQRYVFSASARQSRHWFSKLAEAWYLILEKASSYKDVEAADIVDGEFLIAAIICVTYISLLLPETLAISTFGYVQAVTLHTTLGDLKLELYCEEVRRNRSSS